MRSMWIGSVFALTFASIGLGGCADSASVAGVASAEVTSVSFRRVVPAPAATSVGMEYMKRFTEVFDAAAAKHPEIQMLDATSVARLATDEAISLRSPLGTFFRDNPAPLAISNVLDAFGVYAKRRIVEAAGSDGNVSDEIDEIPSGLGSLFGEAREGLSRALLPSVLQSSAAIPVEALLSEWSRLGPQLGDTTFEVYRVSGTATPTDLGRIIGSPGEVDSGSVETGAAAVDRFVELLQQMSGSKPDLDAFVKMLKASKTQYMFEFADDGHDGVNLGIIDENDQLFVFSLDVWG